VKPVGGGILHTNCGDGWQTNARDRRHALRAGSEGAIIFLIHKQSVFTMSNAFLSPDPAYLATPIGEQMGPHLARRTAVRHATPLLPRSWAKLLAPWRKPEARAQIRPDRDAHSRQNELASQANK
jgi:hypothetical protein